jgi:hypothetical protein
LAAVPDKPGQPLFYFRQQKKGCPMEAAFFPVCLRRVLQPGSRTAQFADNPQNHDHHNGNDNNGKPHACLENVADHFTAAHRDEQQDGYQRKKRLNIFHSLRF